MFDTLRWRLVISHVVVILIAVALAGVAFFFLVGGYRERISAATLRQVAVPVSFQVSRLQGPADARPLLRFLRQQAVVAGVGAVIVDDEGRVLADANPDQPELRGERFEMPPPGSLSSSVDRLYRGTHHTTDGRNFDFVVIPLPQAARVPARPEGAPAERQAAAPRAEAVVLFVPQESAGDLIRDDLAPRLLWAASAGLAAALIAVALLSRWIYRPLGRLRAAAAAVAQGDFSTRVRETGPRETRELAGDFNRMTAEVAAGRAALRDFLLDASHELRTPLTSVRGFSQALVDGTIESEAEQARAVEIIQRETERVLRLVNELSDLARLESGQGRLEPAPVDVAEALRDAAETFGPAADAASVRLEPQPEADLPAALVDPDRLTQVLDNLIDNALRHAGAGSRVLLTARRFGPSFIEVAVTDDGPGIPREELDNVFERFNRGARGNSGLGLAICRELVRSHGGSIWAESAEGTGTRFVFTLPIAEAASQGGRATSA